MVKKVTTVFLLVCAFACEKEVKLDIPDYSPQVVVEGSIQQDGKAEIVLTLTAPYFNDFDSLTMLDYRLTTAKAVLSDGVNEEVLVLKRKSKQYPPYAYESYSIKGQKNSTYQLTIVSRGDSVTSITQIPEPIKPDSIWFEPIAEGDSSFVLWMLLNDPPEFGNYYRTRTKIIGKEEGFVSTRTSVYSDAFFNGKKLKLSLARGLNNILDTGREHNFRLGMNVVLEVSTITKEVYEFWNSYQNMIISSGNPFSSPNNTLKSNVDGGIGIWAGYGVSYDTIFTSE